MTPDAERLAALILESRDLVVLVDPTGRIDWISPSVSGVLGLEPTEVVGQPSTMLVTAEDQDALARLIAAVRRGPGVVQAATVRCRVREGGACWMDAAAENLTGGTAAAVVLRLRESSTPRLPVANDGGATAEELKLRVMFEDVRVAVLIVRDSRVVHASASGLAMFGYPATELLALPDWTALLHEADRAFVRDRMQAPWTDGESTRQFPLRGRRKDHGLVTLEAVCAPTRHAGDAAMLVMLLATDDRVRLEDQLRQAQRIDGISRVAGAMAHDFNNVLAGIRSSAELLQYELKPEATAQTEVAGVLHGADRAAALNRRLLAFGRRQAAQPARIDPNGVIRAVAALARGVMGPLIRIEEDLASGLHAVETDPMHLAHVVLNLLFNARDAMPLGGSIVVASCNEPSAPEAPAVPQPAATPGPFVAVSVTDQGHGFDSATAECLFDPFFSTRTAGAGLGLTSVHAILRQAGAALTAASEPGQGATFTIYLPAAAGEVS